MSICEPVQENSLSLSVPWVSTEASRAFPPLAFWPIRCHQEEWYLPVGAWLQSRSKGMDFSELQNVQEANMVLALGKKAVFLNKEGTVGPELYLESSKTRVDCGPVSHIFDTSQEALDAILLHEKTERGAVDLQLGGREVRSPFGDWWEVHDIAEGWVPYQYVERSKRESEHADLLDEFAARGIKEALLDNIKNSLFGVFHAGTSRVRFVQIGMPAELGVYKARLSNRALQNSEHVLVEAGDPVEFADLLLSAVKVTDPECDSGELLDLTFHNEEVIWSAAMSHPRCTSRMRAAAACAH